ncbi:hypothetical protein [Exiguobacterium undae]|uniref:Lipoprotein n=1 Tax=Exiguobacterium undae TaxID=169177 RepID=A0ABX2VB19_9BACL|nr:hypothetical protein [Exiguobacterium undae]OAN15428.1 hypothetical protein A3783_05700 [Exiguobacterium undae]
MLKQMLVCSLSALLLAGCSSEEAVPKKVVQSTELPLTLEQSSIRSTMLGNEMNDIQTPQSVKLKKEESIFTISLSTTPVGGSSDDTL